MEMMLWALAMILVGVRVEGSTTISKFLPGELVDNLEEFTIHQQVDSVGSLFICSVLAK